ncbi:MAG: hypothetical protein Q4F33_06025, partial [Mycoplasmatota bacterium]|nr:hypothetical protein [Mycoplasmatota bacterium]
DICRSADIVVAAMSKPEMITRDYISENSVVVDVGVHKNAEGKTVGDVSYDDVYPVASLITPPVGGVGPMTICMLAYNTAKARYGREVEEILNKGIEKAKVLVK